MQGVLQLAAADVVLPGEDGRPCGPRLVLGTPAQVNRHELVSRVCIFGTTTHRRQGTQPSAGTARTPRGGCAVAKRSTVLPTSRQAGRAAVSTLTASHGQFANGQVPRREISTLRKASGPVFQLNQARAHISAAGSAFPRVDNQVLLALPVAGPACRGLLCLSSFLSAPRLRCALGSGQGPAARVFLCSVWSGGAPDLRGGTT